MPLLAQFWLIALAASAYGFMPVKFVAADQPATAANRPPNVVIVLIDDLGYADIGPFGETPYKTPNLDRLAQQGRRFTDFVVSSAVCSASRAALMTGCYHRRVGISGALGPKAPIGLSHDETTIAEICKSQGFATACFGKWHLGDHPDYLPHRHGFDVYFGLPYSNDMWPLHPGHVMNLKRNPDAKSPWPPLPLLSARADDGAVTVLNSDMNGDDQAQLTAQYTEHAVSFIREHADEPFFLYLPHSMVHVPLYVSDKFAGKSGKGLFADVMLEVDWSVGQLIDTLDELKLSENTLFVFTSDNGPWLSYGDHAGSAQPLREGKGTMFEGGYRVPTVMRWTDPELHHPTIPPNTTCDKLCSTIDLLPTIANLIGASLPPLPIDGKDIRPLMLGTPDAVSPHEYFYCYYGNNELQAIRSERWKLHFPHRYATLNGRAGGNDGMPANYEQQSIGYTLYDLDNDVSESQDVATEHPEMVEQLKAAAAIARADLGDSLVPTSGKGTRQPGQVNPNQP